MAAHPRELVPASARRFQSPHQPTVQTQLLSNGRHAVMMTVAGSHDAPLLRQTMTYVYSGFSHVLWPMYLPCAMGVLEAVRWRKRTLFAFEAAGMAVEWPDGVETSGRLDRLERDRRPPFTGVLLTRVTHLAALFQEPPDAGGEVCG